MHKSLVRMAGASILTCTSSILMAFPAKAAVPVFDAPNYAQNLLQAARALEQINHEVQSLQNEAKMLQNMAKNLERVDFPELSSLNSTLSQIGQLMNQAQTIDFNVAAVDQRFQSMFPATIDGSVKSDQRVTAAKFRLGAAMESFRKSMMIQAGVVTNIEQDAALLNDLVGRSQGAAGALQAQQATNQLLALSAKQQMQAQELMASEFRSQSLERAREAEAEAEARAATVRFLGTGKANWDTRP